MPGATQSNPRPPPSVPRRPNPPPVALAGQAVAPPAQNESPEGAESTDQTRDPRRRAAPNPPPTSSTFSGGKLGRATRLTPSRYVITLRARTLGGRGQTTRPSVPCAAGLDGSSVCPVDLTPPLLGCCSFGVGGSRVRRFNVCPNPPTRGATALQRAKRMRLWGPSWDGGFASDGRSIDHAIE